MFEELILDTVVDGGLHKLGQLPVQLQCRLLDSYFAIARSSLGWALGPSEAASYCCGMVWTLVIWSADGAWALTD